MRLSDFVRDQLLRDPDGLFELAALGLLERPLHAGELASLLARQLQGCVDEEALGRGLRRFRSCQQLRIIWRELSRQADLAQTCGDL
ncbi:TPA: hypothetical protein ACQJWO_005750, partial [Klebsiella pneumoniae]